MTNPRLHVPALDPDEARGLEMLGLSPPALAGRLRCPDPALVLAAQEGVLDRELADRVLAHVAGCTRCQAAAGDLAHVFDEDPEDVVRLRIRERLPRTRPVSRGRSWRWLAPVGVGLAASVLWLIGTAEPEMPGVAQPTFAMHVAGPLPTVFHPDRPAIDAGPIELTLRGSESAASAGDRISAALDLADRGDLPAARTELHAIVRAHQDSRDAQLALGALLVRAGETSAAVPGLERARALASGSAAADEVDWFLAIAFVRTGASDRARGLLRPICEHDGPRSALACAGLAELSRPDGGMTIAGRAFRPGSSGR